jgi:hypothetical protein
MYDVGLLKVWDDTVRICEEVYATHTCERAWTVLVEARKSRDELRARIHANFDQLLDAP